MNLNKSHSEQNNSLGRVTLELISNSKIKSANFKFSGKSYILKSSNKGSIVVEPIVVRKPTKNKKATKETQMKKISAKHHEFSASYVKGSKKKKITLIVTLDFKNTRIHRISVGNKNYILAKLRSGQIKLEQVILRNKTLK